GPASIALVAYVTPNGQYFATELADVQGAYTLTPAPTNGPAGRIEGTAVVPAVPSSYAVSGPATSPQPFNVTMVPLQNPGNSGPADESAVGPELAEQLDSPGSPGVVPLVQDIAASMSSTAVPRLGGWFAAAPPGSLAFAAGSALFSTLFPERSLVDQV